LVVEAVKAGIFNDLGSGSNVDVTVVTANGGATVLRNIVKPNERATKQKNYTFKRGTTVVLKETVTLFPTPSAASTTSMMDLTA
jgi:20S proteasome subunit beta 2